MNKLSIEKRKQIIALLVEGNSMRATTRLVDCSINTVIKLLINVGIACSAYQDKVMRNLPCKRIQCDEVWSFCYSKKKNVAPEHEGELGYGDVYTWIAICADTKLIPLFLVGRRDFEYPRAFVENLAGRLSNQVQLTTDGYKCYLEAIENAFQENIDYATLVKAYATATGTPLGSKREQYLSAEKRRIAGNPDPNHISTSFVERQNLTMRMSMRRFIRKTNGFSKKIENLEHAVALHFVYYNFTSIHESLRVTPTMEAGISDHVWKLEEIAELT